MGLFTRDATGGLPVGGAWRHDVELLIPVSRGRSIPMTIPISIVNRQRGTRAGLPAVRVRVRTAHNPVRDRWT